MIEGYDHPRYGPQAPLCRKVINRRIGRIRRVFKWGAENELVPPTILTAISAVKGLQAGRSKAHETKPVKSVPIATIKKTLPHLRRQLAGTVRLQYWTAARPGEICIIRACDIDMSSRKDKSWIYTPPVHKMAHLESVRRIAIGPRAQKIIKAF